MCNESKGLFIDSNGTYDKVTNETVSCNENFAAQLMLVNSESFDCQFVGYQCSSYDKFEKGQCTVDCGDDGKKCVPFRIYSDRVFGLNLNRKTQDTFFDGKSKKYYFKTSDKFPYCRKFNRSTFNSIDSTLFSTLLLFIQSSSLWN